MIIQAMHNLELIIDLADKSGLPISLFVPSICQAYACAEKTIRLSGGDDQMVGYYMSQLLWRLAVKKLARQYMLAYHC